MPDLTRNSRERGQTAIFLTMSLVVMLGMVGLVTDLGWAYWRREACQAAAQSAAMAAFKKMVKDGTTPAAQNALACSPAPAEPFLTGCKYAQSNGFTQGGLRGRQTVQISSGTGVPPVTGIATTAYWISATVGESLPRGFSYILSRKAFSVKSRSTVAFFQVGGGGGGGCVYVLDPSANQAFSIGNGATLTTECGIKVNSNAKSPNAAFYATGGAKLNFATASLIQVVGDAKKDGGASWSFNPTTGAAAVADPFAALPTPAVQTPCLSGDFTAWKATPYTPAPNQTYCGFTLSNGNNMVLSSGVYVVNGGTFTVGGGSTLTATAGVTIFLTGGATVNIGGGATLTMSAQSSGPYKGVLFYQDRSVASPGASTFAGGSNMKLTGSLYFPNALLNINNGNNTVVQGLVAKRISIQGGATLKQDTDGSKTGLGGGTTNTLPGYIE